MPVQKTEKIWHNGKLIEWDAASVHITSHVISYGSSLFEGIRCYATPSGPAIFRAREHAQRLVNSCRIYRIELPYSTEQLVQAMVEVVRVNKLPHCYLRPIVLRGYGEVGVTPFKSPIETYIACWPWGGYLGEDAVEKGVDVCISSWSRMAPNTLPAMAKSGANYMNSQLIKMEALLNGYVEGIALDTQGLVSEGSGENLFIIREGTAITPPLTNAILPGITRDTVITLCRDLDIPLLERPIPREELYLADEVFFVGTATEITPIRSIDKIQIGNGRRGPVTKKLQDEFFALVKGEKADRYAWLTLINQPARVAASR
ncbi:branched-chain amino acid transaminase [Acidobacteriia bacterium AH_259_A11_L15]|nr:branched-chain amino acid transaminase [Acidobacteriia bacterium AH_259_A11_L15]